VFTVLGGSKWKHFILITAFTLATLIPNTEAYSMIQNLTDPSTRLGAFLIGLTASMIANSAPAL
jgi:hypothetical protein